MPGGQQGPAGDDGVAILRLFHLNGALLVEALGEGGGELGGHVLDDDHARGILGQSYQNFSDGLGSPGGSTDGNNLVSCLS